MAERYERDPCRTCADWYRCMGTCTTAAPRIAALRREFQDKLARAAERRRHEASEKADPGDEDRPGADGA